MFMSPSNDSSTSKLSPFKPRPTEGSTDKTRVPPYIGPILKPTNGSTTTTIESKTAALKEKLGNVEKDYSGDRDKIASALAGFDEEMTKAGAMMKEMKEVKANLLDALMKEKANVKDLIDSHEKVANERAMGDEVFVQNMENEREHFETEMNEEMEEKDWVQAKLCLVRD